ncbi:MAG: nitroreductase family protein [Bacteroidales bacterium]
MSEKSQFLKELFQERRSCRNFSKRALPSNIVEQIISMAKLSPFAGGRKNWGVEVVNSSETISKIAVAVEERLNASAALMERESAPLFLEYGKSFLFFKEAPTLLIPHFRVSPTMRALLRDRVTEELLQWERENAVKSISAVTTFILLAAESLGVESCYMTGPLIASDTIAQILQLPKEREIGALVPIGYCK